MADPRDAHSATMQMMNQIMAAGRQKKQQASYDASMPGYEDIMHEIDMRKSGQNEGNLNTLRDQPGLQDRGIQNLIAPKEHGEFGEWQADRLGGIGALAAPAMAGMYTGGKAFDDVDPKMLPPELRLLQMISSQFTGNSRSDPSLEEMKEYVMGSMRGGQRAAGRAGQAAMDFMIPQAMAQEEAPEEEKFKFRQDGTVKRNPMQMFLDMILGGPSVVGSGSGGLNGQ